MWSPGYVPSGSNTNLQQNLSSMLSEKWNQFKKDRQEVRENFQKHHVKKVKYFLRAAFLFIACTLMYSSHVYLIPFVFRACDGWTQYYIKVLITYIGTMTVANWLCAILYDTSVPVSRDRPHLVNVNCSTDADHFTGQLSDADKNKPVCGDEKDGGLPWNFCERCNRLSPPRSRHCKICNTCILKRDHHCYMMGCCIGFRNQRYFIVFLCYMALCCSLGLACITIYVNGNFPNLNWSDLFLPVTFYQTFFGDLESHFTLMILHATFMIVYFPLSCIQLLSQFSVILDGRTPYEIVKKIPIRDTLTLRKRTETIFGAFWQLNFLFPAQLFFQQEGNGMTWEGLKMDSLGVTDV